MQLHDPCAAPAHPLTPASELGAATFTLTYCPVLRANGVPVASNLSRHQRAERKTETVDAPDADAAITLFERTTDRMVTACVRAQ